MKKRIIFHIDMDAFFASIEIAKNPSLRGRPVIVGGDPDKRGVVSTCSYEARAYGVRSAMSLYEAKKRCPMGIFLQGNFSQYRLYSEKVMNIFCSYLPCAEIVSIDEAYFDGTNESEFFGGAYYLGDILRLACYTTTSLTCSVGIASNKLVSKIASSQAKPNKVIQINEGEEKEFLSNLPIQALPGIGAKTQSRLNYDGFKLVKDIQSVSMEDLIQAYGSWGYHFYLASRGIDNREVESEDIPPKSIGAETTFEQDIEELPLLRETLAELVEKSYKRLKRHKMRAKGLSVKIRYGDFRTITRSQTFPNHVQDVDYFIRQADELFLKNYSSESPLRLIGVTLEKLTDSYWQPTIWEWLAN